MKTKIPPYVLIGLVLLFPFRYAFLELTGPSPFSLLCMVVTIFGVLIFMLLTISDKAVLTDKKIKSPK